MYKIFKRVVSLLLALVIVFSTTGEISVASCIYDNYNNSFGSSFATEKKVLYKYNLYKATKNGSVIYTGAFITTPMYHKAGSSGKVQTGTYAEEISWSKTTDWNVAIGANYGVSSLISASAEAGFGGTSGWSITKSMAQASSLSESEFKNATTGYYAIAAGRPNYKIKWEKINRLTGKKVDEDIFYMPFGSTSVYTVRSLDFQQTWYVY